MKKVLYIFLTLVFLGASQGCKKDFLTEEPRDDIYAENLFVDYGGFKTMLVALQGMMRHEYRRTDAFGGFGRHRFYRCFMLDKWALAAGDQDCHGNGNTNPQNHADQKTGNESVVLAGRFLP